MIFESFDADIYEDKFPFKSRNSGGAKSCSSISRLKEPRNENSRDTKVESWRSKRAHTVKDFGPNFAFTLEEDLTTVNEALISPNADFGKRLLMMKWIL